LSATKERTSFFNATQVIFSTKNAFLRSGLRKSDTRLREYLAQLHVAPDKKTTPLQKLSAKHNQLQQLRRGSAKKRWSRPQLHGFRGVTPPNPSFMELEVNYPPLPLVKK
jgi:hypothetical protein